MSSLYESHEQLKTELLKLKLLVSETVDAADNMPQVLELEEYIKISPEHKEWARTFSNLREYIKNN